MTKMQGKYEHHPVCAKSMFSMRSPVGVLVRYKVKEGKFPLFSILLSNMNILLKSPVYKWHTLHT